VFGDTDKLGQDSEMRKAYRILKGKLLGNQSAGSGTTALRWILQKIERWMELAQDCPMVLAVLNLWVLHQYCFFVCSKCGYWKTNWILHTVGQQKDRHGAET
jgi:hypothetical protein